MAHSPGLGHFDRFVLLLFPAFFRAIATACFCGLPAFISVLMLELIVLREEPFLRGMDVLPLQLESTHQHKNQNHNKNDSENASRRGAPRGTVRPSTKIMSRIVPKGICLPPRFCLARLRSL